MKPNDVKMLLFAMGIMALITAHLLVRDPKVEAMEALQVKIDAANAEKARLQEIGLRVPILVEEIEMFQVIVENEMLKYPDDVLTETFYMYSENLKNELDVTLAGITVSPPVVLDQMEIMRYINETDVLSPIASYKTSLSFTWEFDYDQLKAFISYVHGEQERTAVESLSVGYNAATGQLAGSAVINKYYIASDQYVYTPPDIPLGDIGTTNPFGTLIE